ncbi:hypothetical protein ACEYW6_12100 [Nostoc sp. UIC 10607]|uniref:hypothetical protein n=1 Tax=Nostoc sp. UIC 10607 TaxID=3045935 RepID=UPI0039A0FD71
MITVVLASSFKRAFKRLVRRQPELQERIEERLALLTADPFDPNRRASTQCWRKQYTQQGKSKKLRFTHQKRFITTFISLSLAK